MTIITKKIIDEVTQTLVKELKPEAIILFGSYAKKTARQESDLDLLIIDSQPFHKNNSRKKKLAHAWMILSQYSFSKDILLYSREEVEKWKTSLNHIIAKALKEGEVLYERS